MTQARNNDSDTWVKVTITVTGWREVTEGFVRRQNPQDRGEMKSW